MYILRNYYYKQTKIFKQWIISVAIKKHQIYKIFCEISDNIAFFIYVPYSCFVFIRQDREKSLCKLTDIHKNCTIHNGRWRAWAIFFEKLFTSFHVGNFGTIERSKSTCLFIESTIIDALLHKLRILLQFFVDWDIEKC